MIFNYLVLQDHLKENKDHFPNSIIDYTMENKLALCASCKERFVEVYCTKCSVIICAFCHLNLHNKHGYKIIDKLVTQVKTDLNNKLWELKNVNSHLNVTLDQNNKLMKIDEKKLIKEEIDLNIDILHKKLNERALELRNSVNKIFLDSMTKINENEQFINNLKKKNKYHLDLIKVITKHDRTCDTIGLSETVLNKLKFTSKHILSNEDFLRFQAGIKFSCDETYEKCISSFEAFKTNYMNNMSSSHNSSEINCQNLSNNDSQTKNIQYPNSNSKTNVDTESGAKSQLLVECVCCKQGNEPLIKCYYCDRYFHSNCHIPTLSIKESERLKKWKCTMCQDVNMHTSKMLLHEWNTVSDVPIHKYELLIIERILLELYCQNVSDDRFRKCLIKGFYPTFYEKMLSCISLNDVKARLESKQYDSLFDFLKDLNQLFINALLYYPPSDPHYLAALELQTFFHSMITKWIPKFDQTKLPQM